MASYYGLCSFVDDMVGKLCGPFQDGLDKSTTVIFSSDHGNALEIGGFGQNGNVRRSFRSSLIITGPDIKPKVEKAPVSLIDIHPTMLEI